MQRPLTEAEYLALLDLYAKGKVRADAIVRARWPRHTGAPLPVGGAQ